LTTVLAPSSRPSPLWIRALYGFLVQYRRTWLSSVAMNFIYPVLYLTAMGVGLGVLVNRHLASTHAASIGGLPYLAFIAPGILASSAMQIAVQEGTWPILGRIKWERTYLAMLQSPLRVVDVLFGQLAFILLRLVVTTGVFLLVMWAFGALRSPEAIWALPIGVVVGMAFATPCVAFSGTQESDFGFSTINRLIVIPLFLFSGSFFPVSQLPRFLQVIAVLTPLYHGVALARAATLGTLASTATVGHLAYLVGLATLGSLLSRRVFQRRLAP
jgi:lipooligosaccharide transport system permease protein